MGTDFLNELGETITKTAREIGEKADVFFETQKLQSRAAAEKKSIDKNFYELGSLIYKRFVDGEEWDEEIGAICEDVTRRKTMVARYREELARLKGMKICPGCGERIDLHSLYCPKCGTPCPCQDPQDDIVADVEIDEEFVDEVSETANEEPEEANNTEKSEEMEEK